MCNISKLTKYKEAHHYFETHPKATFEFFDGHCSVAVLTFRVNGE